LKIHKNLIDAIILALKLIFGENKYADVTIEKVLKSNKKWGSSDRRFIAETVYDMVRWWRLLWEVSGNTINLDEKDLTNLIQIYFWIIKNEDISLNDFDKGKIKSNYERVQSIRAIRESIPDWLDKLCENELGTRWDNETHSLNQQAKVILRINLLKTTTVGLIEILKQEGIETYTSDKVRDALILSKRQNIFSSKSFKDGLFEVQDAASQMIVPFLDVEAGMRVVDACAGGGGKSLHISSLMQNKGRVISLDVEEWKLKELMKRAKRNGAANIETRLITSNKIIKRLKDSADRLLLDVPCSGLGVLKRNPDAKWKLNLEKIDQLKIIQQSILNEYSNIVKAGGKIVYSTCSILPSENENQIKKFLQNQKDKFELIDEKTLSPYQFGFDGFYMAKLVRKY
jgi:16S rRNA (cytosine967-C5)-methyltransferase